MFLVFPLATPFGIAGVGLGAATPVFVIIFNTIGWSLPACGWFILTGATLLHACLFLLVLCECAEVPAKLISNICLLGVDAAAAAEVEKD